jgi:phosphatidylserine/phosphatidylglycerophosphate/cardiolipin synthase-like enzyme
LDDPIVSLQARISIIRNAQQTLDIATYIYGNDESATQTLQEIVNAAERGVKVRLIVDALNNHIPKELTAYMISKGIRIKVFNKFAIKKELNNVIRMHAKIIVSDHLRYIVGGRNIVNSYFYIGDQTNFRDREIYVVGRSGKQAGESFDNLWFSALLDEIEHDKELSQKKNLKIISEYLIDLKTMPFLENNAIQNALEDLDYQAAKHIDIVIDRPHSYKYTEKNTTDYILSKIENTKNKILVESPYVVFSPEIYSALQKAINRGVTVEIVTNSMMTSDSYLVLPVYYKERDQLIQLGFDIYEYQGEGQYLHTKMFIFDDEEIAIGSYNLDMLSANINTEIMVVTKELSVVNESLKYYYQTKTQSIAAQYNPFKPILLEGKINMKSIKKYTIIKVLEWTLAPYLRDYL